MTLRGGAQENRPLPGTFPGMRKTLRTTFRSAFVCGARGCGCGREPTGKLQTTVKSVRGQLEASRTGRDEGGGRSGSGPVLRRDRELPSLNIFIISMYKFTN